MRYDSLVRPDGATPIALAADGQTGCYVQQWGEGRACYMSGYGDYERLLKAIVFWLAKQPETMDRLDAADPAVRTYFYPDGQCLIAYNMSGVEVTTTLRFDPAIAGLGDARNVLLSPSDGGKALTVPAATLRAGWQVKLASSEARYWRVSAAGK